MDGKQLYALTTPLLTTSSGAKMGKTASGAVWLNDELFSPYEFWQYFRNTEDADVGRFLKIFTRLPLGEIAKLAALGGAELNEAKERLASEATKVVHGAEAAEQAAQTAHATFKGGTFGFALPTVEIRGVSAGAAVGDIAVRVTPHFEIGLLAALVSAGLAGSNGEARRHVQSGAVRVNDQPVTDEKFVLTASSLLPEGVIKLSVGKKKHALLKPV
jgi:tyrosyl-tRNA synthetase